MHTYIYIYMHTHTHTHTHTYIYIYIYICVCVCVYAYLYMYAYIYIYIYACIHNMYRGCPRGVMVKAMDCGIVVRKFVIQSRYNVHFRANTLGKGMNPLILTAIG